MIEDIEVFGYGIIIGIIIGALFCFILVDTSGSKYISKEKLNSKQTLKMKNCFVQYSAVRRFPK